VNHVSCWITTQSQHIIPGGASLLANAAGQPHTAIAGWFAGTAAPAGSGDRNRHAENPGLKASFISLPDNAYNHLDRGGRGWYPLMYQTATINPYDGENASGP
jgi:hypothetical protein